MSSTLHLHCPTTGSGPTVFLIHAFPMDHTMWDAQVAALNDRYSVSTPDLPGFGQSPPATGWRVETVAESVIKMANTEGLGQFGVVGLSMGTYAAFEIYRQAPERVRFLVLANGRARADNSQERESRTRLIAEVQTQGLNALEETILPRLLGDRARREVEEQVQNAFHATTAEAVAEALEALRERRDSTRLLEQIRCRTLVIGGGADSITPSAETQAMAQAIPGARFREIPTAGHLSNLDFPQAFNTMLSEFLDED